MPWLSPVGAGCGVRPLLGGKGTCGQVGAVLPTTPLWGCGRGKGTGGH